MFKNIFKNKKEEYKEPHDLLHEFFIKNGTKYPINVINDYLQKYSKETLMIIYKNPNPELEDFLFARDLKYGKEIAEMIFNFSKEWDLIQNVIEELIILKYNKRPASKSEDEINNELIDKWVNEQKKKKL